MNEELDYLNRVLSKLHTLIAESPMPIAEEIENSKIILTRYGLYVGALWHVSEITDRYKCDPKVAMGILDEVLNDDELNDFIVERIVDKCVELKLEENDF